MRLSAISIVAATFLAAAALSVAAARLAVTEIEDGTRVDVRNALDREGMTWAEVDTTGLQVFLAGTAPSEATRFKALSLAGGVVDAARILDQMLVAEPEGIAPPRFSVEILRNDSGVSLIGLVPASTDRAALLADIARATDGAAVTDLLEAADYPEPDTWQAALGYAVRALRHVPRAKVSADAERVRITAMAESPADRRRIETDLARRAPADVGLALDISAPRPVITPFTLRFVIEDGEARFDACSADTEAAQARILRAAGAAGLRTRAECIIGLGVPSPRWGTAAEQVIAAMADLGGGSVTMTDADISLLAVPDVPQDRFDDVVGRLETSLPEVFALHARLPDPPEEDAAPAPEFVATLSPEGLVHMRGRVGSELSRDTMDSFARARFRSDAVHSTARVAEGLPEDWPLRLLTGLEALSYLSNGAVTVMPETLQVAGQTGRKEAGAEIAQLLSGKLGEGAQFSIDVSYREELDPIASIPTPEECEQMIARIVAARKIVFEPGSATVGPESGLVIDDIAEVLRNCGQIRMEIGGHTDSQGREIMNEQLSRDRARAVLSELRMRRVLTSALTAKGYGETRPIADNGTEAGREANRRIEFRLIRPDPVEERVTGLESLEKPLEDKPQADAQDGTPDE